MKAVAVFPKSKEVKLIEQEEAQISQPQQIKLRMLDIGVCGTDKEICLHGFGRPPKGSDYLVLGHESLGQIIEVGPGVKGFNVGDFVVPIVRHPCTHIDCHACRAGRQDFCQTDAYSERGIKEEHGYMTEYVVEDEQYLYLVPPELRSVGVLVEPLTIAEKALTQNLVIQQRLPWFRPDTTETPGEGLKALVLGAGPIGILGAMLLKTVGYDTYVYSRAKVPNPKSDIVEAIGAKYFSTETTSVEELGKQIGKFDLIYEGLGGAPIVFEAMQLIGPTGIFIFTSVPDPHGLESVNSGMMIYRLVMHNQFIGGTVNAAPASFASAIHHLEVFNKRWPDALQRLIQRYPIEDYKKVLLGKPGGIKNVITFNKESLGV